MWSDYNNSVSIGICVENSRFELINPSNGSPRILQELQTRYVKSPAIYNTRAISINKRRAVLHGNDAVALVQGNNQERLLVDNQNRALVGATQCD